MMSVITAADERGSHIGSKLIQRPKHTSEIVLFKSIMQMKADKCTCVRVHVLLFLSVGLNGCFFAACLIIASCRLSSCQVETEMRAKIRWEICAGRSRTAF